MVQSIKDQNHHLPKFIKKSICHQNAAMVSAMLKNALMENVKLMIRNNHQSLSSKSQILTGRERIKRKNQLKQLQLRLRLNKTKKKLRRKLRKRSQRLKHQLQLRDLMSLVVFLMPSLLKKSKINQRQRLAQDGHTKSKNLKKILNQPKRKKRRLHISQFQRRLFQALLDHPILKPKLLITT